LAATSFLSAPFKALETTIAKLRKDLERIEAMMGLALTKPWLRKQKRADEKMLFMALAEISKVRTKVTR
jgi:hypothetical protein